MKILTTLTAVALFSITSNVQAASIGQREAAQRNAIRDGYADGSLTGPEARRLRNQQIKLERKEQRFLADGEVTTRERANMRTSLNASRVAIYRQRHDGQQRD